MGKKLKVLWVSDLGVPTGFGKVSHSILEFLHDKYEVVGLGINYRGDPHNYPYPIYPASLNGKVFGEDRLVTILNNTKFDILFLLNDAWIISNYLRLIKSNVTMPLPKVVTYFPVDSGNHDPDWYENYDMVSRAVTYTEYGKSVVNDQFCAPDLKLDIIPHGINQKIFYKKFTNKRDARQSVVGKQRDPESFIFLSANRNQPRKRLDITMKAFKLFAEGKNDVLLHMHCGVRDSHIDIAKLAIRLGIDDKLVLTNLNSGIQQISDEKLNDIYNSADVGLNSSMGEGWGLTNIEHAITGAPQIVPDHSACREIYSDCGLLVPTVTDFTFDNSMTVGKLISPEAMAEKMHLLYTDKALYANLAESSLLKFSDPKYSWEQISETWDKLFLEVTNSDEHNLAGRNS